MLRVDDIKRLRKACEAETGGNNDKSRKLLVGKLEQLFNEGKLSHKDINLKAAFEALVDIAPEDRTDSVKVAEAVASSAFSTLTTLIVHRSVIEPYEMRMNEVMELVSEDDASMTDDETIHGMTPLGGIRRRLETEAYDETDFSEKKVTVRKSDFGRIISLTMEDIFNDRTGKIREKASSIGEDAGSHQEKMIIETLEVLPRTAFNESASRAFVYEGVAHTQAQFYSTDHSAILDGQVNSNRVTGGITEAGFTNAYNCFATPMTDERGKEIVIRPEVVVVRATNDLTLNNLLATERALGNNNNDINQFGPRGRVKLKPIVTPFLASTAGLFYMGVPRRSLKWLWVERPQTVTAAADSSLAFERRIVWRARFNYYGGVAHRDYRWVVRGTTA